MNILQIGDNDLYGGRFNGHDLHLHLNNRSPHHSKHLVWKKHSDDETTYEISSSYSDRIQINQATQELNDIYSTQAIFNVASYDLFTDLNFLEADVVHYHLIHNDFFGIPSLPILGELKPIVWTLHDPWAMTGHCVYPAGCERWKIGCGNCPNLNLHFAIREDTSALNWELKQQYYGDLEMDIVVASKYMLDMVNQSPLLTKSRKHLVPFGLDLDVFKPRDINEAKQKLGIDTDEIVLCFRNVDSQFKGIEYIYELLDRFNLDVKLCLLTFNDVGNLSQYSSKFKLIELGWVLDEETLVNAYNAADIFLMPSKEEAFGMMAMEAMACAKPVVVMDNTSLAEIIYPQLGGGCVVPQGDILRFCDIVDELILNTKKRLSIGTTARKIAEDKYCLERYTNDLLKVYDTAKSHYSANNYLKNQLMRIAK